MIFVSGIHGVGKTYFCNEMKKRVKVESYSASQLIADRRNEGFSANKLVSNIDDNQDLLVAAINELREAGKEFILDGHFCLLSESGEITRIPLATYMFLRPDVIILLTEKPEVIAERRMQRDQVLQNVSEIKVFQQEEECYAKEIAEQLGVFLVISRGKKDIDKIVDFVKGGAY